MSDIVIGVEWVLKIKGIDASPALRAHVTGLQGRALAVVQASEDGGREGASSSWGT